VGTDDPSGVLFVLASLEDSGPDTIPLKHVKDVLLLRERDGPGGSVPVNPDAKKLGGGTKVPELEVGWRAL